MLSVKNLNRPSNKRWKAIADFFLFTMPLYLGAVLALPLTEEMKMWINFGVTVLIISLKGVSKFTQEDDVYVSSNKTFADS